MARIRPLEYEEVGPEMRAAYDEQVAQHGRMTNMKRTLAHSPAAFRALMQWYPLFEEAKNFLGERAAILFVHAISTETDCLICSTFFRRMLIQWGENPDDLSLNDRERTLIEFGRALARDPNGVSDGLFSELRRNFSDAEIVTLTAWGGVMIATNVFNNALRIPLDEYLLPYRKQEAAAG